MSTTLDKRGLRAAILEARRAMTAAARAAADAALVDAATDLVRGHTVIAAYAPMPGEPGGPALLQALAAAGPSVLLPVLRPDLDLAWARWTGELGPAGPVGVREPTGAVLDPFAIAQAELVLVPGLAVDRNGNRLGRGGGSYDRALGRADPAASIVAVLYAGEFLDHVPAEPHDARVTHVLTPAGLTLCGSPDAA